jgi:hypothetical protein
MGAIRLVQAELAKFGQNIDIALKASASQG